MIKRNKTRKYKKITIVLIIAFLILTVIFYKIPVYATSGGQENTDHNETAEEMEEKPIVVVIDPGHGGENEGAHTEDYIEKELTLDTALAMKRELEKYEGIEVYLTRESDVDMSLTERTAFAKEVEADFFVCLHYNMSALHKLYGAECWISSYGECYAKGKDLATIEMEMLTELGLYDRGIKTRHNSRGTDYYGVIRSCTAYGIPSVLIEHCHLDQENDRAFIDRDTWPETYGKLDAMAVARYFSLKSDELGVDYSGEIHEVTPVPEGRMGPDTTPPEWCRVTDFSVDEETGIATGKISAYDPDSRILYYTVSFNYGNTYHEYYRYEPDENGEVSFEVKLPKNTRIRMVIGALNLYGGLTRSELLYSGKLLDTDISLEDDLPITIGTEIDSRTEAPLDLGESGDGLNPDEDYPNQKGRALQNVAWGLLLVCIPVVLYLVFYEYPKRKKKQRERLHKSRYDYEKDGRRQLEIDLMRMESKRTHRLLQKSINRKQRTGDRRQADGSARENKSRNQTNEKKE